MKNVVYTYLLVATMVLFSFAGTANAVVDSVDFDGSFVNMGTLSSGQHGIIDADKAKWGIAASRITALLPSHSAVTFSYNFSGDLKSGLLAANGEYAYTEEGNLHEGYARAFSNTSIFNSSGSFVNMIPLETALVYAYADLDTSGDIASATFTNMSGGALDIASAVFAFLKGNKKYTISYEVTETPIPAALPMFSLGLCAIAGIRRRKKAIA
jgi:hypothetical protein